MRPILKDGVLYVPMAAYGDGIMGDGMIPMGKDNPQYESQLADAILSEQLIQRDIEQNVWGGKPRRSKDG